MKERDLLDRIFEFEVYVTHNFDSLERRSMAVYEFVKQLRKEYEKNQ